MHKRLCTDLRDAIIAGEQIFWNKTEHDKNYNYHVLWAMVEKNLPDGIAREYILPCLEIAITQEDIQDIHDVRHTFTVKKTINNRKWEIRFRIPVDFPFKPPKFTINGLSSSQLKNIGNNNYDKDSAVLDLLVDIDLHFYNQWSPAFRLVHCIDFIRVALDIHHNLPYKSNFMSLVEKSSPSALKVS